MIVDDEPLLARLRRGKAITDAELRSLGLRRATQQIYESESESWQTCAKHNIVRCVDCLQEAREAQQALQKAQADPPKELSPERRARIIAAEESRAQEALEDEERRKREFDEWLESLDRKHESLSDPEKEIHRLLKKAMELSPRQRLGLSRLDVFNQCLTPKVRKELQKTEEYAELLSSYKDLAERHLTIVEVARVMEMTESDFRLLLEIFEADAVKYAVVQGVRLKPSLKKQLPKEIEEALERLAEKADQDPGTATDTDQDRNDPEIISGRNRMTIKSQGYRERIDGLVDRLLDAFDWPEKFKRVPSSDIGTPVDELVLPSEHQKKLDKNRDELKPPEPADDKGVDDDSTSTS